MSYGDRDPIAALATPSGESALALIRISGESSIEALAPAFSRPKRLLKAPGYSIVQGWVLDAQGKKIDQVLVSVYRSPKSYTGEDGADISCHGGIATVKAIMAVLRAAGFREALPGEFSFRAFMNGKLDLTRCESVMELVSAKTGRAREQAIRRLSGVLEKEISSVKTLLVQILAGAEIYLDYSEDEFIGSSEGDNLNDEEAGLLPDRALAEEAAHRLKALSDLWHQERIYAEGALAALAGRPNAGKSSLFNYLLREERSIVTDAPGTTRDWIEALISLEGIPLQLADTAGLRDLSPGDEAERIGIERSLEIIDRADLVLYLIDGTQGFTERDRDFLLRYKEKPCLVLWNKADISPPPASIEGLLPVSAKTGEGIPEMLRRMAGLLEGPPAEAGRNSAGPGSLRQKEHIDSALASVEEALALAERREPLDIIAPLFRSAVNSLGEITGEVSTADILETMFSRFCVGK